MIYRISHRTTISYAAPVSHAQFNIRLLPIAWPGQSLLDHSLRFDPQPAQRRSASGPYLAETTNTIFSQPIVSLNIECMFRLRKDAGTEPGEGIALDRLREEALASCDMTSISPVPYLFASRIAASDDAIAQWAAKRIPAGMGAVDAIGALNAAIHDEFAYQPGTTDSATPPAEAFARKQGVCQDFAHVMIIALRSQGIPAAYVSGYLRTIPPAGMERLVGADAMHAWVNVWCGEQAGWVGFDPTNNCLARQDHVLVAMGRDYADVSPIDGVFIGQAPQEMQVAVDVVPEEAD